MTFSRTVGLILSGTLAVTGCGDKKPSLDQSSPNAVVKGYLAAVADGKADLACQALAPAVQRRAIKLIGKPTKGGVKTCKEALDVVAGQYTASQQTLLRQAKVTKVAIKGSQATVTSTGSGKLAVTKTAGRWTITGGIFD
jgi:hypothetical protein